MEMVFCFCHTERWRETIQLINGHVVQKQWNIRNRQSCVEMWIQVRSESLMPILLIVSLYIIMNDEAAILERLNMTDLSFLDIFNIHLICDKLLWRLANASKWTCWDQDFIHRLQDVWLSKLRQVLPHSGHHVQNQTCPLGRGSLCCRQDGDICMYKKVEGSGTMCL